MTICSEIVMSMNFASFLYPQAYSQICQGISSAIPWSWCLLHSDQSCQEVSFYTLPRHSNDISSLEMQELAKLSLPRIWHARWECSAMCSTALTRWTTRPWGKFTRVWPKLVPGDVLMSSTAFLWRCCLSAPRSTRYLITLTPAAPPH